MNPYSKFLLQHPAILEERRKKYAPPPVLPPSPIPTTLLMPEKAPPPKKIKEAIKKHSKEFKVEIQEPPKEEEIKAVSKRKTRTIKNKVLHIAETINEGDVADDVVDVTKKISTIAIQKGKPEAEPPQQQQQQPISQ